jgi:hypothetical protein
MNESKGGTALICREHTSGATRKTPDFAFTADDIVGLEWKSGDKEAPGMAEGITVLALMMANTCFYLLVPCEVLHDHLASKARPTSVLKAPRTASRPASRVDSDPDLSRS